MRLTDLLLVIFVEMNIGKPSVALKPWSLTNGVGTHFE